MLIKLVDNDFSIVFPQANDIYKVIKYIDNLTYKYHQSALKHVSLDFVPRQEDYYKNAATYLGLYLEGKPTDLALHLFKLDKTQLFINMVQLILKHEIFYRFYLKRDEDAVENHLRSLYKMTPVTAKRRASTVVNWIKWCDAIIKENALVIEEGDNEPN